MSRTRLPTLSPFCLVLLAVLLTPSTQAAEDPAALLRRARAAAAEGDSQSAVRLATGAIDQEPNLAAAYYLRGRELFRLSRIDAAVRDFDRYVELRPDVESRQWERGIALYYAGQYQRGAAQFELYQTFSDADVENSVWRFLCTVESHGVEKARSEMLPVRNDPRVPMMQVLDLYRGKTGPDELLAAVERGNPSPVELAKRQFYAFLYLGLFFDATNAPESAAQYVTQAADERFRSTPGVNSYMWDVARIHSQRLRDARR